MEDKRRANRIKSAYRKMFSSFIKEGRLSETFSPPTFIFPKNIKLVSEFRRYHVIYRRREFDVYWNRAETQYMIYHAFKGNKTINPIFWQPYTKGLKRRFRYFLHALKSRIPTA